MPSQKRDCPHCFARVLPPPDGLCPSCRGDMSVAKTLPLTTVTIRIDDELPPLCVACGVKTEGRVKIGRTMTEGGTSWFVKLLAFLWSPIGAVLLSRELQGKEYEASVILPFCEACAAGGTKEPRPSFVNFQRQELSFIVHDDFANAFREG